MLRVTIQKISVTKIENKLCKPPHLKKVLIRQTVPISLNACQRHSLKILAFLEQKDYFKTFTWPRLILIS